MRQFVNTKRSRQSKTAIAVMVLAGPILAIAPAAAQDERVYTIGNYPVEATADNAVAAKRSAIDDGRKAAFRSLLKRIVPVTAYQRIKALQSVDPRSFIKSVGVKSERSSGTRYIASLDYAFSSKAVGAELRRRSIPYVDKAATLTTLVAIYSSPAAGTAGLTREMTAGEAGPLWLTVWNDLDLANSVTPLKVRRRVKQLHPDTVAKIASGDMSALRILATEYGSEQVLLAIAEPDPAAKRLNILLSGRDAVGAFTLKRRYRIDVDDFAYSLELAAVVGLGIIEGRWKAVNAPGRSAGGAGGGAYEPVQIWVEFANLAQWRRHQQSLEDLPGVEDFQTGGLSADGASVQLRYPGGGAKLRNALAARGLTLTPYNDTWILR